MTCNQSLIVAYLVLQIAGAFISLISVLVAAADNDEVPFGERPFTVGGLFVILLFPVGFFVAFFLKYLLPYIFDLVVGVFTTPLKIIVNMMRTPLPTRVPKFPKFLKHFECSDCGYKINSMSKRFANTPHYTQNNTICNKPLELV